MYISIIYVLKLIYNHTYLVFMQVYLLGIPQAKTYTVYCEPTSILKLTASQNS